MSDIDSASTYMAAARRDAQALANMLDESLFPLEIFGFHAQQTIEKCLKAWLCLCDIDPPQSHNLRHLLVLLESSGIQIDDWWGWLVSRHLRSSFVMKLSTVSILHLIGCTGCAKLPLLSPL